MVSLRSLLRPEVWGATLAVACASETEAPKTPAYPDEYVSDCRTGDEQSAFASDESYIAFVEAEAAGRLSVDGCQAPEWISPTAGTTLNPSSPTEISFRATAATCKLHRAPSMQLCPSASPVWERGLEFVLLERVAHAHCGAFTGENYLLRLTRNGEPVYTALLSTTSYVPDAEKWSAALRKHRGATVELSIERAVFNAGRIVEGPFVPKQTISFQVTP